MALIILNTVLIVFGVILFVLLVQDFKKSGIKMSDIPMTEKVAYAIMGFVLNIGDTLGIGSNATQAAFFKFTKYSPDDELPGNGNVLFAIPVIVEALIFTGMIEVDIVTLITMLLSSMIGAIIGARIVTRLPIQKVRSVLAVTLPCVAVVLVCKINGFGPFGLMGDATGLTGGKLIIGIAVNFVLGMLMCAGVGLYAPCMALCALLGLNISVAFPIMMGSCAILMPPASREFIKAGKYNRKAALIATVTGIFGVLVAAYIIKSMPTTVLTYIIACVLVYMAISFIMANKRDAAKNN